MVSLLDIGHCTGNNAEVRMTSRVLNITVISDTVEVGSDYELLCRYDSYRLVTVAPPNVA